MKKEKKEKVNKIPFKPLGDKVLLKVKKFKKEEVQKTKQYVEGSSLILSAKEVSSEEVEREITGQTRGEVIDVGPLAFCFDDGTKMASHGSVVVGDVVVFSRYGAVRLGQKDLDLDYEYWLILDKDLQAKEVA